MLTSDPKSRMTSLILKSSSWASNLNYFPILTFLLCILWVFFSGRLVITMAYGVLSFPSINYRVFHYFSIIFSSPMISKNNWNQRLITLWDYSGCLLGIAEFLGASGDVGDYTSLGWEVALGGFSITYGLGIILHISISFLKNNFCFTGSYLSSLVIAFWILG